MVICPAQQKRKPGTLCPRLRFLFLVLILILLLPLPASPEPEPEMAACPTVQIIPLPAAQPEPEAPPPEARVIEDCTVTWYTADTCGKAPDHPAYGITASGLPVEEGVTCAVDPEVIPLFSEVYVHYEDGTVERLRATDTGVDGSWVDIYTPDYDYAVRRGLQHLTVYWLAPEAEGG